MPLMQGNLSASDNASANKVLVQDLISFVACEDRSEHNLHVVPFHVQSRLSASPEAFILRVRVVVGLNLRLECIR